MKGFAIFLFLLVVFAAVNADVVKLTPKLPRFEPVEEPTPILPVLKPVENPDEPAVNVGTLEALKPNVLPVPKLEQI